MRATIVLFVCQSLCPSGNSQVVILPTFLYQVTYVCFRPFFFPYRMSQIFKHLIKEYSGQSQLSIVHLPQTSIFQQLLLEESIYRISPNTSNAWLFFNNYTELLPDTCQLVSPGRTVRESQSGNSIVLGISGIPDHVVIKSSVENDNVELIRRYTVSISS